MKNANAGLRRRVSAPGVVSVMRLIYAEDRSNSSYWPLKAQEV